MRRESYKTKTTSKSSEIADASFIGLECDSGDVSNCNDGTDESSPPELQGYLILSETETKCGSKCNNDPTLRSSTSKSLRSYWTLYTSQAIDIVELCWKFIIAMQLRYERPKWFIYFQLKNKTLSSKSWLIDKHTFLQKNSVVLITWAGYIEMHGGPFDKDYFPWGLCIWI